MPAGQTQPKPGHLHGTSVNPTARVGRDDGFKRNQDKPGYRYARSTNPTSRGGVEPEQSPDVRGTQLNVRPRRVATRDIGDGVVR